MASQASDVLQPTAKPGVALRDRAFLALIVLGAVLARLPLLTETLNYDESQHFLVAKSPWFADFWREFRDRAHPPLGYLAMKVPLMWSSSASMARLLSLACGLA